MVTFTCSRFQCLFVAGMEGKVSTGMRRWDHGPFSVSEDSLPIPFYIRDDDSEVARRHMEVMIYPIWVVFFSNDLVQEEGRLNWRNVLKS